MPPKSSRAKPERVSVADQKAAGVSPDDTVTIAEQEAGEPLPGEVTPEQPVAVSLRAGGGTGNESPAMPATVQAGAARAHGMAEQMLDALAGGDTGKATAIAGRIREELARYVPDQLVDPGRAEAASVVSTEL